jgi:hypothetical protein
MLGVKTSSGPGYFQFVVDALHALDVAERLLGHLLLEVRSDHTLQNHSSVVHDAMQVVPLEVGSVFDGGVDPVLKAGIARLHEAGSFGHEVTDYVRIETSAKLIVKQVRLPKP